MIKIIYGVKKNSSACELIFPLQDSVGISNFINQSIIKNDYDEQLIGKYFFSIHFFNDFYVFSRIKLVYDSTKRLSYLAYIIASKEHETNYNILEELYKLENQYTFGKPIQQNRLPLIIKTEDIDSKNTTVAVCYSSGKERKKYLKIDKNYKQYSCIYFIDENDKGELDPIKALKNYDVVVEINKLISVPEKVKEDTENGKKQTLKQLVKDEWQELLVAFVFGGLLIGSFAFFYHISNPVTITINEQYEIPETDTIVHKQDFYNLDKDTVIIQNPQDDTKKAESDKPIAKEQSNKTDKVSQPENKQKEQLPEDMEKFLQVDCKNLTLEQITQKINSFANWKNTKNLLGFANFLELMKKNPPNKQEITKFIDENKINFNEQDEYVEFVRYMSKKEEAFFDSSTKNIRNISTKTLQEIETIYGYK